MRCNSENIDWGGQSVLNLDCQIKGSSLFARLSGVTDNFASGE